MTLSYVYRSPVGGLLITGDGCFITGCQYTDSPGLDNRSRFARGLETVPQTDTPSGPEPVPQTDMPPGPEPVPPDAIIARCVRELDAYFSGALTVFTVPVKPEGTPFRKKVWAELARVPYGTTLSYGELAARIGSPKAARAVGGANHHNPVVILIPCHRVLGADGSLTGFGGGLDRKEFLLALERNPRPV